MRRYIVLMLVMAGFLVGGCGGDEAKSEAVTPPDAKALGDSETRVQTPPSPPAH